MAERNLDKELFDLGYLKHTPEYQLERDGYSFVMASVRCRDMFYKLFVVNTVVGEKEICIKMVTPKQIEEFLDKNKNKQFKKTYNDRRKKGW